MTIYQEEMRRRARPYGCDCIPNKDTGNLDIYHGDEAVVEVTPKGHLLYPTPKDKDVRELVDKLIRDAKQVREYVGIYEAAPAMIQTDVSQYRLFSEYGSTVLAGTYDPQHGFLFCTWDKSADGAYVAQGHYTTWFDDAKEDFAVRSGLVRPCRLFDIGQSIDIADALEYQRANDENLLYEVDKRLENIQEHLIEAYPQIQARLPSQHQESGMTMGGM